MMGKPIPILIILSVGLFLVGLNLIDRDIGCGVIQNIGDVRNSASGAARIQDALVKLDKNKVVITVRISKDSRGARNLHSIGDRVCVQGLNGSGYYSTYAGKEFNPYAQAELCPGPGNWHTNGFGYFHATDRAVIQACDSRTKGEPEWDHHYIEAGPWHHANPKGSVVVKHAGEFKEPTYAPEWWVDLSIYPYAPVLGRYAGANG